MDGSSPRATRACGALFQRRSTGQTESYRRNDRADARTLSIFQRATRMTTLLPADIPSREDIYETALALLADGIALLQRDGGIVYVNEALRRLAAAGNEIRIERNAIEFACPDLRNRFARAMSAVEREAAHLATDFAVPREGGQPPYTVSVRPLSRGKQAGHPDAAAMLLVHDPSQQSAAAAQMLRELYGLTNAEAQLVQAVS